MMHFTTPITPAMPSMKVAIGSAALGAVVLAAAAAAQYMNAPVQPPDPSSVHEEQESEKQKREFNQKCHDDIIQTFVEYLRLANAQTPPLVTDLDQAILTVELYETADGEVDHAESTKRSFQRVLDGKWTLEAYADDRGGRTAAGYRQQYGSAFHEATKKVPTTMKAIPGDHSSIFRTLSMNSTTSTY